MKSKMQEFWEYICANYHSPTDGKILAEGRKRKLSDEQISKTIQAYATTLNADFPKHLDVKPNREIFNKRQSIKALFAGIAHCAECYEKDKDSTFLSSASEKMKIILNLNSEIIELQNDGTNEN